MLVELAAANAAFAVIKEAISNSGELMQAGKAVAEWFDAKSSLQKKVEEKPYDQRSDLEEFFALEQLKQQQEELKQMMIYQGRPGLWDDWLMFQAEAKRKRDAEARRIVLEEQARKEADKQAIITIAATLGGILTASLLIWFTVHVIQNRGI
jgi:hypothetical protein